MDCVAMKGALNQEEALHAENKSHLEATVKELEESKTLLKV